MEPSIFITYNPEVWTEEATALRLQTIAHLYGLRVELPDRLGAGAETNTRERIRRAGFVVAFPLQNLSAKVHSELNYAISEGKTIIVVYDKRVGQTVEFNNYFNVYKTEIDFDTQNTDSVLHGVAEFINRHRPASQNTAPPPQQKPVFTPAEKGLLAFLGVGLGIVALAALLDDKK